MRKKPKQEYKVKTPPREMVCQYCKGVIVHWEEDRADNDQCCTYCWFMGRDWSKMIKRIREP